MINIPIYISLATLQDYNEKNPLILTIQKLELRKKETLRFDSKTDRWELTGTDEKGTIYSTLLNNTTIKNMVAAWGSDEAKFAGKKIKFYQKQVRGKIIIYGEPIKQ